MNLNTAYQLIHAFHSPSPPSVWQHLREKQPAYLHSMLAASIPSRSLRSNNDNSLPVPRVKTNTGARAFHSCALSLWNNLPLSVRSGISVATFKKYVNTHLFDSACPHRYRHFPWPVDVTELFPRFFLLNTDLAVAPLSLASPEILALYILIDWYFVQGDYSEDNTPVTVSTWWNSYNFLNSSIKFISFSFTAFSVTVENYFLINFSLGYRWL